jgi:hypothetical protein
MQRVEVLRGPQGNPVWPKHARWRHQPRHTQADGRIRGSLSAMVGNYARRDLTGVFNLPFGKAGAAMRIAGRHTSHDGYGRAQPLDRELNEDDTDYVRAQLRLKPASAWTADVSVDITQTHTGGQLVTALAASSPATDVPAAAGHPDDDLDAS